ncbi:MAG: prepilin-type N-terminal cleavage/methylation domain-containing protein [Planctomycetes bacterium]|nr:prepilin-type N-terminal cleavage/methylation domain-containing protein [Planctomycetota bacterium]
MERTKAFTLIELLVVIAIIALLMSIIVPSLRVVKEVATGAVCLANQKGLSTAWHLYQENYDGLLVGGSTYYSGTRATPYRWVERPLYHDSDNPELHVVPPDNEITLEYRLNGIRAGKLFPYTNDVELYHCPGDRTMVREIEPYAVYRSYAITGLMNGEDFIRRSGGLYSPISQYRTVNMPNGQTRVLKVATRFTDIRSPGNKHVFVEEDVSAKQQVWNQGGFVLMENGNYWQWWDWPAYYHNDQSTIGFADGHAEKKRWEDQRTIDLMKGTITDRVQNNNPDMEYMNHGYIPML